MKLEVTAVPVAGLNTGESDYAGGCFLLRWLGQAGFDIFTGGSRIMIDPYLSDFLAQKYAGKEFAHRRMMAAPVEAGEIHNLDYLLCTHRHSDHLDYGSVPVIMRNNLQARILAPRAEYASVLRAGALAGQIIPVNAGESIELSSALKVSAIPACHEELKTDTLGNHHYLGYILSLNGKVLYHSGDCIPYAGQVELLREHKVDMALLPINGRDEYRRSRGVPGNMTFDEAVQLCLDAGIKVLICQHFGMFEFNTADMQEVKEALRKRWWGDELEVIIPDSGVVYKVN